MREEARWRAVKKGQREIVKQVSKWNHKENKTINEIRR